MNIRGLGKSCVAPKSLLFRVVGVHIRQCQTAVPWVRLTSHPPRIQRMDGDFQRPMRTQLPPCPAMRPLDSVAEVVQQTFGRHQ